MALLCLPAVFAVALIAEPERPKLGEKILVRVQQVALELWRFARDPRGLLVLTAVLTPIGVGAASFLFGGIAAEWGVGSARVALVTGFGAAMAAAVGALLYARLAERADRMLAFLTTGTLLALAAVLLAVLPRTPGAFTVGTLNYAMLLGAAYGAFTALILDVVGRRAVATKFTALYACGNAPVAYMPALNGWVHDRWSTSTMLWVEAGLGLFFVCLYVALYALTQWRERSAVKSRAEAC
jgi:hypothetical protein